FYYLLFIGLEHFVFHSGITSRAALETNPLHKAYFLLMKALPQAFYFNLVIRENSVFARLYYILAMCGCLWLNYRSGLVRNYWLYLLLLFGGFALIYLPSVIIKENFASNRTLLAVDMAVFCWVVLTLMRSIKKEGLRDSLITLAVVVLGMEAIYNFRSVFLRPAEHEYAALKDHIDQNYRPGIGSIDYIRSPEGFVRDKYGVASSWDEYGFSSSYFAWVPDALTRQLVFEKTGDRSLAEGLNIRTWVDQGAYKNSGQKGGLLIDAPAILTAGTAPSK
ncbi:MAG: hypothetical protein JST42_29370, partial [Bacteroidetes bacterium]|nr:hypothetical protein [Bacteroidota bacterium]